MKNLLLDLRFAMRLIVKNPWYTVMVVLILGIGVGANVAIFSAVNSVLLRPLPYADPNRLMALAANLPEMGIHQAASSSVEFMHLRQNSRVFSDIGGFSSPGSYNLSGMNEPERVQAMLVTGNFFSVLGVQPLLGRAPEPRDETPGMTTFAILSHSLWKRRFDSDPQVIGKRIRLDSDSFTVIAVLPPTYRHPTPIASLNVEVWVPAGFIAPPFDPPSQDSRMMRLVGRLKPGNDLAQAQAELKLLGAQLQAQYPDRYPSRSGFVLDVRPLHERIAGDFRPIFITLFITVIFVLLIACTNVANLFLSRANVRRREMAIRAVMGASRARLSRQLLTESLVLSLLGGLLGLLIAYWFSNFLSRIGMLYVPGIEDVRIDWQVLLFTLVVSLATTILFGLAPSLHISKPQIGEILKESAKGNTGGVRRALASDLLVVLEFAMAFVLLMGAGLLIRSSQKLQQVNLGFNPEGLLTMQIALGDQYGTPEQRADFFRRFLGQLQAVPGVKSAGTVTALPLSAALLPTQQKNYPIITIRDRQTSNTAETPKAEWHLVSPEYFRTMGIPLVRGNGVTEQDNQKTPMRVVINQTLADRYFPNQDPIGKSLKIGNESSEAPWMEVIGVVADFKNEGIDTATVPEMYVPYNQLPEPSMSIVVRTEGDPASLGPAVLRTLREIDPNQPVFHVRSMREIMTDSLGVRSFSTAILGVFALVALLLAGIGIYGVMSYSVTQRAHEIGVRMAIGARPNEILKLILKKGGALVLLGTLIGALTMLAAVLATTRYISGFLFGIAAFDLITILAASALLIFIGLAACCIPAFRAMRGDPLNVLRGD